MINIFEQACENVHFFLFNMQLHFFKNIYIVFRTHLYLHII